ncbi:MAG: ATP-dependent Clp protease proteolytic subunit [Candidatus Sumerlaeia bacterium]|nr:ATP-dependent Clp protease proteolytic subunit [Candidatus Sumerlaeia bacterium]
MISSHPLSSITSQKSASQQGAGFRSLLEELADRRLSVPVADDDDDDGVIYIPVPRIIEQTDRGERVFDLFSRLLVDRIVMINREFNDRMANLITAQLLFLESQDPEKPIHLYINSPGGVVTSGLAIYDTMQFIRPKISTTVIGLAASMGAVILQAGAAGQRFALPNARIMIHQPSGGSRGTSIDIEIQTRETVRIRETLYRIIAKHTGRTEEEVFKACDRDNNMSPEEAREFGLIDEIIVPKKLRTTA